MIPTFLEKLFGKNWRTTALGWIESSLPIGWAIYDSYAAGQFNGKHGIAVLLAVLMVIRGYNTKDKQVTGGSIKQ